MASSIGFVQRHWNIWKPAGRVAKSKDVIKFGILGAASIAPSSLITPAKSHPEVIVQAVAARSRPKAEAFAKKHGIPQVFDSYQVLLDDPAIDAVYIPLPNGLHYEWALKALAAGKHVLLEKPSCSNAAEAELLFRSPLLQRQQPQGPSHPVILVAFHYRFQPSWRKFLSLLDRPNIAHASARMFAPAAMFSVRNDIRFNYALSGGALLDLAGYPASALRDVFAAEPEACLRCDVEACPPPNQLCDHAFRAAYRFPGGATGEIEGDLLASLWRTATDLPCVAVRHGEVRGEQKGVPAGRERVRTRTVTLLNFVMGALWHRIDVEDEFVVREIADPAKVFKRWRTRESTKAYTFAEMGVDGPGEAHWLTYRYQLEEFVDRVRGRPGTGVWMDGEDSIAQMRMIDMAYEKTDLPLRPTSKYRLPS